MLFTIVVATTIGIEYRVRHCCVDLTVQTPYMQYITETFTQIFFPGLSMRTLNGFHENQTELYSFCYSYSIFIENMNLLLLW